MAQQPVDLYPAELSRTNLVGNEQIPFLFERTDEQSLARAEGRRIDRVFGKSPLTKLILGRRDRDPFEFPA